MRVVVVGATGNVGTSVVSALARDEQIGSIVGLARRRPAWQVDKTGWGVCDIRSGHIRPHLAGADCVVHLAWQIQPSRDIEAMRATNVDGTRRLLEAVVAEGVRSFVYASSIGAYAPGPRGGRVTEDWPARGISSSFYARHKAEVEWLLDAFEQEHPEVRVVRLRPGLTFKREAASGIRRLFAGPLAPTSLAGRRRIPVLPIPADLRIQAVHTDDVAEAYRLAVVRTDVRGAFNVAADPVLTADDLAEALGARPVHVPFGLLRAGAALSWRMWLQPTPPGWVDMARAVPMMDTTRARTVLGWSPTFTSREAFADLLDGMAEGSGLPTPPLGADAPGRRVGELARGPGNASGD
ncbi:MAG TPA: NAD-dependent epimerase/dehydratase family protein [Actinomycetota bacterium]|nr:NAD-dependent epimerase/dehydratase family protein [Actinomycetota bacterium]